MRDMRTLAMFSVASLVTMSGTASADTFIGTFVWQQQPYCNRLVLDVTQIGTVFALEGYDDQCGAARRASVNGTAFENPNGTIGLAMAIVTTPGAAPVHIDASIDLNTLSGQWTDSSTATGTFLFNGPGAGSARPLGAKSGPLEINATLNALPEIRLNGGDSIPDIVGYRVAGSLTSPLATSINSMLVNIGGGGFGGTNFTAATGQIYAYSREQFTDTAHGTALFFATTPNGSPGPTTRMMIEHNGNVGIGAFGPGTPPLDVLHVNGEVRVNACVKNSGGGTLVGICPSDERLKRNIDAMQPMLSNVARLRPVQFAWRADEFPSRAFGNQRELGLIAQEVEQVLPELVSTDADGFKAVNYTALPLLTLQAVKELKAENDQLKEQNAALERRLAIVETALGRMSGERAPR